MYLNFKSEFEGYVQILGPEMELNQNKWLTDGTNVSECVSAANRRFGIVLGRSESFWIQEVVG